MFCWPYWTLRECRQTVPWFGRVLLNANVLLLVQTLSPRRWCGDYGDFIFLPFAPETIQKAAGHGHSYTCLLIATCRYIRYIIYMHIYVHTHHNAIHPQCNTAYCPFHTPQRIQQNYAQPLFSRAARKQAMKLWRINKDVKYKAWAATCAVLQVTA